jgi:hypothetical protein
MSKELGHISQLVCLQSVDHGVLLHKALLKVLLVDFVYHTETLSEKPIVTQVCSLLAAALKQHDIKLHLSFIKKNAYL